MDRDNRIKRIVREVEETAFFRQQMAEHYGLPPEAAKRITATTRYEIMRQAQALAAELAEKESETPTESTQPIRRKPVPGHAAGYAVGDEVEFDPRDVVRRARGY